jgi:hypothetical protein
MPTTRSARLWASSIVGRPSGTVYTCPAGLVTILKSVAWSVGPTPNQVYIGIGGPAGIGLNFFHVVIGDTDPTLGLEQCWIVLEPGDEVTVFCDAGTLVTWGSGAQLSQTAS